MGKIEIDHTGTGAGITLSSDGTDLLLDGAAIGGGGAALELYAENPVTPVAPSATGLNAVAIGSGASAATQDSIAIGTDTAASISVRAVALGYFSTASQVSALALGTNAHATGYGAVAIGGYGTSSNLEARSSSFYSIAIGVNTDSTALGSVALGYNAQAIGGSNATALTNSRASGTDSFAAAIANNTSSYGATGSNSVAIGDRAKATGSRAFATGYASIASGNGAKAFGGFGSGTGTLASKEGSTAIGDGARSDVSYKLAISTRSFAAQGDAQTGITTLRAQTTNATPIALYSDTNLPDSGNQVILPNNSAYAFHGTIVARQQASQGTASAAWKIEGLIRREGSAGTTVLVNSATTVLDNTPAWGMALTADVTNGGLAITATGAAATNIRWVATIHTSEVTY